jgi:hypothetical protein
VILPVMGREAELGLLNSSMVEGRGRRSKEWVLVYMLLYWSDYVVSCFNVHLAESLV